MPETPPDAGGQKPADASVNLYWLPLGAGGSFVRLNGRIYEFVAARLDHRQPLDLYHSALEIRIGEDLHTIEVAPVWSSKDPARGVVAEGPVGAVWAGRLRAFRYEIRCWSGGSIPDVSEAVDSPRQLSGKAEVAARAVGLVGQAPTATWGRDELGAGEMWNSNSVVSWLLYRCGIDASVIDFPSGGRAPGWQAGIEVASRQVAGSD
jgi:hypothetical protein